MSDGADTLVIIDDSVTVVDNKGRYHYKNEQTQESQPDMMSENKYLVIKTHLTENIPLL